MARTPFTVEVLTPEGEVFNDEVEMLSTRTTVGSIGVLANHQPLLTMLDPTELRLHQLGVRGAALRPGRGLPADVGHARARARRRGVPDRRARRGHGLRPPARGRAARSSGPRRTPRRPARRRATSAATRRSPSSPRTADASLSTVDERALAERLITYDTSKPDGIRACAGFIKGWLEAREIDVHDSTFGELPVLLADVGPTHGPDADLPRPPRRRARPRGAVLAADRGRPAVRPRRLRHEGRRSRR